MNRCADGVLPALLCLLAMLSGCLAANKREANGGGEHANVAKVEKFRALLKAKDYEAAQGMMSDDPRRWFNQRSGAGRPWRVGPGKKGPWADWDEHFRGKTEGLRWEAGDRYARHIYRETNEYYLLLERGSATTGSTYLFDDAGRIEGLLITAIGDRPPGRTDEFLAWAKEHDPAELDYLKPGGEIDPSGDRPQRFRILLNRWRRAAGLETIE